MNIEIPRINQGIENSPSEYIKFVNMDYLYKLSTIVDNIEKNCHERPVILLAGPSGSGKTTTAMMIEQLLDKRGHETHTISMDNYFCPLTEEEKALAVLGKVSCTWHTHHAHADRFYLTLSLVSLNVVEFCLSLHCQSHCQCGENHC